MAAHPSGDAHTAYVVDSITTTDVPDCRLCKRIDAVGTLPKRLIVCCDGTSNSSNQGVETNPTNIARLSRAIANVGYTTDGTKVPQIVYYQSGIGTDPSVSEVTKIRQQSLGAGLNAKVCEAYNYLANNYGPGDELFIFGFSRGAYTARVLASFVCQFGLMTPGMLDYFDEVFNAYKKRKSNETSFAEMAWSRGLARPGELGLPVNSTEKVTRYECLRRYTHMHVKIRVIGVFDTVGSVGMSGKVPQPGQDVDWHSSSLHPKMEYAFHALSIDETRGNFAPTLFYMYDACQKAGTVLRQCWFPGYHGDIGGHSDADWETNSVDLLTFAWMVDQITEKGLLQFSKYQLYYPILSRVHEGEVNGPKTRPPKTVEEASERRVRWSDGYLQDSNSPWPYYLTSLIATRRLWHVRTPGEWRQANGKDVDYHQLHETIHPCVAHRQKYSEQKYRPAGLSEKEWRYDDQNPAGPRWIHTVNGREVAAIPEYRLMDLETRDFEGKDLWSGSLERFVAPQEVVGHHEFERLKTELLAEVKYLQTKL